MTATESVEAPTKFDAESIADSVTEESAPVRPRRTTRPLRKATNAAKKKVAPKMPKKGELAANLTQLYATIGLAVMPFDQHCGAVVFESADKCSQALEDLAAQNPAVLRALLALTQTTAWGAVLAAHAPLIIAVARHHSPYVAGYLGDIETDNQDEEDAA